MLEIVFDGIRKFGAEIISAVLFTIVLWGYKRSRTFLKQYNRQKQEVKNLLAEVKRLEGALNESELQKSEEIRLRESVQRQLEASRKEQECLKAEIQHKDETLMEAESRKAELQSQLEFLQQEAERLKSELRQKEEALRQVEAQKQEEASHKSEPTDAHSQYELGLKHYENKEYE